MSYHFHDLPVFPIQKKVTLEDKELITIFASHFLPSADFKFASLWSYNTENDAAISRYNDNLILKFRDYITNESHYSFLGKNLLNDTAEVLLQQAKKEGILEELRLIPEDVISYESNWSNFRVLEDEGNHDYILSVEDMTVLPGSKFHTQKNHINKFHALYPNHFIKILDPQETSTKEQIEDVFFRWEKARGKMRADTEHELTAIQRLLDAHTFFKLLVIGLFIDEKIQGFSINDLDNINYAQNHFAKSDPEIKQAYYKLNQVTGHELKKLGYSYLNIECDLGIEGLRFAKKQWNPVSYIKKYTISKK